LFLDELLEFRRRVLESLRQPIEEGWVSVSRVRGTVRLPARFQLVAAMNPCPCGRGSNGPGGCSCTPYQVRAYQGRLSGPLLDRIDLHVEVPALSYSGMTGPAGEPSSAVAARGRPGPGPAGRPTG
jgi:magnesium chelatase family protein